LFLIGLFFRQSIVSWKWQKSLFKKKVNVYYEQLRRMPYNLYSLTEDCWKSENVC
jgi:hypothetical protein